MDAAAIGVAGIAGAVVGGAADRLAARWPEHDDGSTRPVDWRTAAVIAGGVLSAAGLVARFGDDPTTTAYLAPVVIALVVLLATDLDQRLLPDLLTYPIPAYAVLGFVLGVGPFVRTPGELGLAAVGGVVVPGVLFLLSLPFGAGAIGIGDLKLLFGMGLLIGAGRLLGGVAIGAIGAAVAILVLIAARRITLRSYVPYGPFLIAGTLWAMLGPGGG